jgi:2-haloacid dehalogenase
MNRRNFLWFTAAGAATGLSARWMPPPGAGERRIEAVAFDAFPILDPRPVVALAERLFPGRGSALGEAWRTRQFQYQWLRALSSRYASFWQATEDSLEFAAEQLQLELTPEKRARLMNAHLELQAWPDAAGALRALQQSGMRLAILSNATPNILAAGVARSGLGDVFEHVLSTDTIRTFKPDPRAYRLGAEAFQLPPQAILFVAFAGWDAAGAKWFGFPTYWVNRANLPPERLGVQPDGTGKNLADLVAFVRAQGAGAR